MAYCICYIIIGFCYWFVIICCIICCCGFIMPGCYYCYGAANMSIGLAGYYCYCIIPGYC